MAAADDTPETRPPWMPPHDEPKGEPPWDQDDADWLIGKYLLAGITYRASDGKTVESKVQYHGRITKAERSVGITVACEGAFAGQSMTLPPDLRAYQPAPPGEYRLRGSGEVVTNPDLLTQWSITAPAKSS